MAAAIENLFGDCCFESEVVEVTDLAPGGDALSCKFIIRASLASESEAIQWLSYFKVRTSTNWVSRAGQRKLADGKYARFLFSRDYVCHHSQKRKVRLPNFHEIV